MWKLDGNAVGKTTPIKIQELAANGLSRIGSETTILTNTLAWEGPLVEGPWMVEQSGAFYLFYSGNGYASSKYGVGVARSEVHGTREGLIRILAAGTCGIPSRAGCQHTGHWKATQNPVC